MAKVSDKKCPKCGNKMWDNTVGKKPSPNYPDFKCTECGEGIWLTKQEKETVASQPAKTETTKTGGGKVSNYGNSVPPSMYGAWCMNLVISFVAQGKYKNTDEALKDLQKVFAKAGTIYNGVVDDSLNSKPVASEPLIEEPVKTKAKESSEDSLDLGDLEDSTFDDLDI